MVLFNTGGLTEEYWHFAINFEETDLRSSVCLFTGTFVTKGYSGEH
jgi:hypothetical protein